MKANLFFDFDMTLGYRIMMWRDTVRELLLEEGVIVSIDEITSFSKGRVYPWSMPHLNHTDFFLGKEWWENTKENIYENLLTLSDSDIAERVADKFRHRYIDISYWRVFKDTIPALNILIDEGYSLYILSNHVPEALDIISSLGLSRFFKKIFISAYMGYEKPNPMIYRKALLEADLSDINIMIGDNYEADIEGALSSGFQHAIMVRRKNENNYKYYASNLLDTIPIIRELTDENR